MPEDANDGKSKDPPKREEENWEIPVPGDDEIQELVDPHEDDHEENPTGNLQPAIQAQPQERIYEIFPSPEEQETNYELSLQDINSSNPASSTLFNPSYFPDIPVGGIPDQEILQGIMHLGGRGRAWQVGQLNAPPPRGHGRAGQVGQENAPPPRGRGRAGPVGRGNAPTPNECSGAEPVVQENALPVKDCSGAGSVVQDSPRERGSGESVAQGNLPRRTSRASAIPIPQGNAITTGCRDNAAAAQGNASRGSGKIGSFADENVTHSKGLGKAKPVTQGNVSTSKSRGKAATIVTQRILAPGFSNTKRSKAERNVPKPTGRGKAELVAQGNVSTSKGRGRAEAAAQFYTAFPRYSSDAPNATGKGRTGPVLQGNVCISGVSGRAAAQGSVSRERDRVRPVAEKNFPKSISQVRVGPVARGNIPPSRVLGRAVVVPQGNTPKGSSRKGPVSQGNVSPFKNLGTAAAAAAPQGNAPLPSRDRGMLGRVAKGNSSPSRGRVRTRSVTQESTLPTRGLGLALGGNHIGTEQGASRGQNINTDVFRPTGGVINVDIIVEEIIYIICR